VPWPVTDACDRPLARTRIVFRDPHDEARHHEADEAADEEVGARNRLGADLGELTPARDELGGDREAAD